MSKIVKAQILDAEEAARACETGADRVGRIRKYPLRRLGHRFDDRQRFRRQLAIDIVSPFVARMLHIAHQDAIAVPDRPSATA